MRGKRWVLTAAMLVAGVRLWMQVRGKTKTPFQEWAIGWGATFFFLAMVSEVYETAAAGLAGAIVVGDFLVNGADLFKDMTGVVTGTVTGQVLSNQPFAASASSSSSSSTATSSKRSAAQTGPHQATAQQVNQATGATP